MTLPLPLLVADGVGTVVVAYIVGYIVGYRKGAAMATAKGIAAMRELKDHAIKEIGRLP